MSAQKGDIIFMDGEKMELYSNPLEEYWTRKKKKRPSFYKLDSCRRGYVASWEIRDKQLLLKEVDGDIEKRSFLFGKKSVKCTLKTIFPKNADGYIKADWFSGKLRIPRGNMIQYEHSGYESRFQQEIIVTVEEGNVIKMVMLDYTKETLTATEMHV